PSSNFLEDTAWNGKVKLIFIYILCFCMVLDMYAVSSKQKVRPSYDCTWHGHVPRL
ncbi:hypothetical protein GOP47_0031071, partial [Adiantum capillus-veneris]